MYSNQAIEFKEYYINTHNRWLSLLLNISKNPTVDWGSEFQELVKVTMELFLDFRLVNNELIETETKEHFTKTLISLLQTSKNYNTCEKVKLLRALDSDGKWDSDYGMALLSGKIVRRFQNMLAVRYDIKLLKEDDSIVCARIKTLMNLFQNCDHDEVLQMIMNSLETYKKFIIAHSEFQNKLSKKTVHDLLNALLVVTCFQKKTEHLNSMISLMPESEKLFYLKKQLEPVNRRGSTIKMHLCHVFIVVEIIRDLLITEFRKPRSKQSVLRFNMYLNIFLNIAKEESFSVQRIESVLFSVTHTDVISDYYFLIANLLRDRMPNLHKDLVLNLYVIGLSIDITYLEKVKYGKDSNRDEFLNVHRRLYLVLIVLGFIIEDLPLRRLCVEAASVCEFTTNNSMLVLEQLPHGKTPNNFKNSADKLKIYDYLRSLLGNMISAIKINKKLIDFYEKSSIKSYENLEYLNRTRVINTVLTPIIYPGIERQPKLIPKQQENNNNNRKLTPDFHRVLQDNENFLKDISNRFQLLGDPFESLHDLKVPTKVSLNEIRKVFMIQLNGSIDFHIKSNDLFFAMPSITLDQILNYHNYLSNEITQLKHQNENTLFFDFNDRKCDDLYEPIKCDLAAAYNEGVINVLDFTRDNNNFFDIENIMFYAIHLKKAHSSLVQLPKITPVSQQLYKAFHYLIFRGYPSTRSLGNKAVMFGAFSLLDAFNAKFAFDIVKYKYSMRINNDTESQEMLDSSAIECSTGNDSLAENSMEIDTTQEKPEVKKKVPKKSHRKEAQSNVVDSTTTTSAIKFELLKPILVKKEQTPQKSPTKQPKITTKFDCKEHIDVLHLLLQNELSFLTNQKIDLDISKKNTPIFIDGQISNAKVSQFPIKVQKKRGNSQTGMLTIYDDVKMFIVSLPIKITGQVDINIDIIDSISYSNSLRDEAILDTKVIVKISGSLNIENLMSSWMFDVSGTNVQDSKIKLCCDINFRRRRPKRVSNNEVVSVAPTCVDGSETIMEVKKESKDEFVVIESNNENDVVCHYETVIGTTDYAINLNEHRSEIKIEDKLLDVEMPLIVQQDEFPYFNQVTDVDVSREFEPINYCKVELILPDTLPLGTTMQNNVDLKNINQHETTTTFVEESQMIMPTINHTLENEIKPEPRLNETFEHNISKSPELLNVQIVSLSLEHNIPQNCDMEVPIVLEKENDSCCIDLTDDDHNIPKVARESGILRTYSKYDVSKLLHQQYPVKNVTDAIDFESMMPCAQLAIPEDLLHNETERARWRCEMKKDTIKEVPPVKKRCRPGPACHVKRRTESRESNARPFLHSVNRSCFMKKTKKCSVVLLNCLQDIHLDDLRTDMIMNKNKVNLKLPPSISSFNKQRKDYSITVSDQMNDIITTDNKNTNNPFSSVFHIYQNQVSYSSVKNGPKDTINCNVATQFNTNNNINNNINNLTKQTNHNCNTKHSLTLDSNNCTRRKIQINQTREFNVLKNNNLSRQHTNKTVSLVNEGENGCSNRWLMELTNNLSLNKTFYSDKNPLNFAKNLKMDKKFTIVSKGSNCQSKEKNVCGDDGDEECDNKEKDKLSMVGSLDHLYRVSRGVFDLIPGLNSLEYFELMPNHTTQIEVVHVLKSDTKTVTTNNDANANDDGNSIQIKFNNNNATQSQTSTTSNLINFQQSSTSTNATVASVQQVTNIQRVGHPMMSEQKPIQTSFGSIIKNTYPPAISRNIDVVNKNHEKINQEIQKALAAAAAAASNKVRDDKINDNDNSTNINSSFKIIACGSNNSINNSINNNNNNSNSANETIKTNNKNQTLINMLSQQQVLMPGTSLSMGGNRHFIITSNANIGDNSSSSSSSSLSSGTTSITQSIPMATTVTRKINIDRRTTTNTTQSQLIQILNSPPSNFTVKPTYSTAFSSVINTITTTSAHTKSPNQPSTIVSGSNFNGVFKNELQTTTANKTGTLQPQHGLMQFICKTDGKIIHLTPICSTSNNSKKITYKVDTSTAKNPILQPVGNQQIILNSNAKKCDNQNLLTIIQKHADEIAAAAAASERNINASTPVLSKSPLPSSTPTSPMSARSVYEENYAKFIQTSSNNKSFTPGDFLSSSGSLTISSTSTNPTLISNQSPVMSTSVNSILQKIGRTVIQQSNNNQILPKFNQAFGKSTIFQTTHQDGIHGMAKTEIRKVVTPPRPTLVNFSDNNKMATRFQKNMTTNVVFANHTEDTAKVQNTDYGAVSGNNLVNFVTNNDGTNEKSINAINLQNALQNGVLYARSIGNGKLLAGNAGNSVLLTTLRNNPQNNVRIITSMADSNTNGRQTIMTPVRISVPIQIPQLINSARPGQVQSNFRQQIVIAGPRLQQQQQQQQPQQQQQHVKLENLLLAAATQQHELEDQKIKVEVKQKKNVDISTLEQLREFDMVLEQVKERSTVTPTLVQSPPLKYETQDENYQKIKKLEIKIEPGIKCSPVSMTSTVSVSCSSPNDSSSSKSSGILKATPKSQEDEQTAQRILDILANYKEQVRNSPDLNNKPAPRRRANPPTNPATPSSKRKKFSSMKNSKQYGSNSDMLDMDRTMGSEEDSSCGMGSGVPSTGSVNNSPRDEMDDHTDVSMDNNFYMEEIKKEPEMSPQSSSSSVVTSPGKYAVARRLIFTETKPNVTVGSCDQAPKKYLITNAQQQSALSPVGITVSNANVNQTNKLTQSTVLMSGNYLLPMNMLKGGQQLAILSSNNGQKIIAVPANQISSPMLGNSNGTPIIFQRYINQQQTNAITNDGDNAVNRTLLTTTNSTSTFKSIRLQQPTSTIAYMNNRLNTNGNPGTSNTLYIRPIQNVQQNLTQRTMIATSKASTITQATNQESKIGINCQNIKFLNDKTLITEIIHQQQQQQQQQMNQSTNSHQPQQNFLIKFNDHTSDGGGVSGTTTMRPLTLLSRPQSSIVMDNICKKRKMSEDVEENVTVKIEKLDEAEEIYIKEEIEDVYVKEEIDDTIMMQSHHDSDCTVPTSPMMIMKVDLDENTNSNHHHHHHHSDNLYNDDFKTSDGEDGIHRFPLILNSYLTSTKNCSSGSSKNDATSGGSSSKGGVHSHNIKGYLIDPSNKILMQQLYNDRKPAAIEKEYYNQKSFSDECADLGVDEPIASDLFPEADLLFDSASPSFDQMTHENHGKKEIEHEEILLEMDTDHWLNFSEEELIDSSRNEVDDNDDGGGSGHPDGLKTIF